MRTVNSQLILSVEQEKATFFQTTNIHNLCINATSGVQDIDQVSFPSVDITSEVLVQKFHIHPVCTGATKVGKLQVQQRTQPKLATNQSQSFFRYIRRRFIFLQKTYFYSWFILQVTFDKFCWLKK